MFKKDELRKFQKEALESHNEYRSMHGTPKLKLADDLNKIAQAYAEELAKTDSFRHSKCDGIGENLAMHFSSKSTDYCGGEATKQWYSEIEKYKFDRPGFTPGTGHFTQVVWAETKEMGIGKAVTRSGKVIAVANYRPTGNMLSKFKDNVLPPKKGAIGTTKHRHRSSSSSSSSSSDDEEKKLKGKLGLFKKKNKDSDSTDISKSELRKFQKEMLTAHNKHREKHGVPALKLSDEVCKDAQKFAEKLAKTGKLEHSTNQEYGENVGMHYSSATTEYSGTEATNRWYSEVSKYDFSDPRFKSGIGHFTQMVWKNSKQFGIGKAITKDKRVVVVASYEPPGNYIGQFPDNVFNRTDGYLPPKPDGAHKVKIVKAADDKKVQAKNFKMVPDDLKSFQKDALEAHNKYRSKHKAPALKESKELTKMAQEWAEHLVKNELFEHRESRDTGENIAMHYSSASTNFTGKEATDMWYSEISKHDFSSHEFQPGSGHFTQVVWKGSKDFGIGKAITKEGKVIVVGNYRPPGNIMQRFAENVSSGN
ncbi:uncharacterized protein LOC117101177 [Anneissia japonica]|uniref:uncharacterized protein LOC117101177 n=1 Tax=Anneissia japonica TaxID=1529436 RepID=UPI0014255DF4|nr:uncharacterized protein LOC117101177 [Anneissia japonica]